MKLEKKIYTERSEKRKDFLIGVGIFIGLNIILLIIGGLLLLGLAATSGTGSILGERITSVLVGTAPLTGQIFQCLTALPFLINLLLMIYFALTRPWIALGMAAVLAVLFVLGFFFGCIASAICFAGYATSGY